MTDPRYTAEVTINESTGETVTVGPAASQAELDTMIDDLLDEPDTDEQQ